MVDLILYLVLKPIAFPKPEEITRRYHLERWAQRAKRTKLILLSTYFIGFIGCVVLILLYSSIRQGTAVLASKITYALLVGSLCSGPILLLFIWMALSTGIKEYERLVGRFRSTNRVCSVCDVVALYEDRYLIAKKRKRHTKADLVPRMHVIKEDGQVNVLCDQCLAEVSAMDETRP